MAVANELLEKSEAAITQIETEKQALQVIISGLEKEKLKQHNDLADKDRELTEARL